MALIKKISVKTVCGDLKAMLREGKLTDGMKLMRVFGIANGIATGVSEYGPWVAFKGTFEAMSYFTGKISHSGRCLLPDVASEVLEGVVLTAEGRAGVEFGFEIILKFDDKSATGYIFEAEPILAPAQNDPLMQLKRTVENVNVPSSAEPLEPVMLSNDTTENDTGNDSPVPIDSAEKVAAKGATNIPKKASKPLKKN